MLLCDTHKMETNYGTLRMPDFRALAREHGLRGHSRLRKAGLIAFLQDNLRPMPSPRPPSKIIPAQDLLRKLYLLQDRPSKPMPALKLPSKPMLAWRPSQSVKIQPKSTRPPKPMRPAPPPPEDSFNPYESGRAFGKSHWSFRINGRSGMDGETFLKETSGSVTNLITEELQDSRRRCKQLLGFNL